jgi:TonB family protein
MKAILLLVIPALLLQDVLAQDRRPKPLEQPLPIYPAYLKNSGVSMDGIVEFVISETGEVVDAEVVNANSPAFDEPALDAVYRWKFEPAMKDGLPVSMRVRQGLVLHPPGGRDRGQFVVAKPKTWPEGIPEAFRFDVPPVIRSSAFPVYPFDALKEGRAGKVDVVVVISPTGAVIEANTPTSDDPALAAAARAAAQTMAFDPASKKGSPCGAVIRWRFHFLPSGLGDVYVPPESSRLMAALVEDRSSFARPSDLDVPLKPRSRPPPLPPLGVTSPDPVNVIVEFVVNNRGSAILPRVVNPCPEAYAYAACQAIASWRFNPPTVKGKPVEVLVKAPLTFSP